MTARDQFGNVVTGGNPGFALVSPALSLLKDNTVTRTVSGAETTFVFSILQAAVYIMRFEDASGALHCLLSAPRYLSFITASFATFVCA